MKRCLVPVMAVFLMGIFQFCWGQVKQNTKPKLNWLTNYQDAVSQAQTESKPLLLFFTGTGWCPACIKLEEEVFNTTDFVNAAGAQFVFVKVDFPQSYRLDPQTQAQNEQLKSKFDVRSFPTIILLDNSQQQIGLTGYRPGSARSYASHLLKMVTDYQAYRQKMQQMGQQQHLTGADLKQVYDKALELHFDDDVNAIVAAGLNSDMKLFFQMERYRMLAEEGCIHDHEARDLRQQLVDSDPNNERKTHYQLAVIDFEAYSEEMDKENYSPDLACEPLTAYIEKFGKQDKENLWRLEMIISQVYLDRDKISQALKYAQSSYDVAPATVQPEIAMAIKNIQAQQRR